MVLAQINFTDGDIENLRQVYFRFIDYNMGLSQWWMNNWNGLARGIFYMRIFHNQSLYSLALGHLTPVLMWWLFAG